MTVALAPLFLVVYPHGLMVNRGWIKPPTYYAFGFLAAVRVMSFGLLADAIRSRSLAEELTSNERRWRSLLDSFSLLAIGCSRDGLIEYVNPFLLRTSAFGQAELLGRPLVILGIVATVLSGVSHWRTVRRLRRDEMPVLSQWPLSITVAVLVSVAGVAALWSLQRL